MCCFVGWFFHILDFFILRYKLASALTYPVFDAFWELGLRGYLDCISRPKQPNDTRRQPYLPSINPINPIPNQVLYIHAYTTVPSKHPSNTQSNPGPPPPRLR